MHKKTDANEFPGVDCEVVTTMDGTEFHCVPCDFFDVSAFREGNETRLALGMHGPMRTGLFIRLDQNQLAMLSALLGQISQEFQSVTPGAAPDPQGASLH